MEVGIDLGFNSFSFLLVFLPAFLAVYYIVPRGFRNGVLALGSIVFYCVGAWSQPWSLGLPILWILLSYPVQRYLYRPALRYVYKLRARLLLGTALAVLFGGLFAAKLMSKSGSIAMPLALSFYTFQIAAYLINAYRGRAVQENFIAYAGGILLFPKLLSGPLMNPVRLNRQMNHRVYPLECFDLGLRKFIAGLSLKVLLADQIGGLWRQVQTVGIASVSTAMAWVGLIACGLQLYFDFWGYSVMARGLGMMLGFRLPTNFAQPYSSKSVSEFWRRWHITLGAWFRDYVYIPLGGSRKGTIRTVLNLLVVWVFTGLWHGVSLNFLIWGLFLFFFIVNEKLWLGKFLEKGRVLPHLYLLLTIFIGWLFFSLPDVSSVGAYLGRLFPLGGNAVGLNPGDVLNYLRQSGATFSLGLLFVTPWPARLWKRIHNTPIGTILCVLLFWACFYCISVASGDPFLYFSF